MIRSARMYMMSKFIERTLKLIKKLPICAKESDGKKFEDGHWLKYLCKSFHCSLLRGNASVMVVGLSLAYMS